MQIKEQTDMKEENGIVREADIECTFTLKIKESCFKPGRVRVHLPAPVNAEWLYMGQVLTSAPAFRMISIEDHPQRSTWFDEVLEENRPFSVTYAFESAPEAIVPDIGEINRTSQPGRAIGPALIRQYEEKNHCDCSSYTGPLADKVTVMDLASETAIKVPSREEAARILGLSREEVAKFFGDRAENTGDLINLVFRFCANHTAGSVAEVSDGAPESRNILLVMLMRALGVPARWQGGFRIKEGTAAPADWAIVNAAPYGWIYMDAEAAHEAFEAGNRELAEFYFGGIDALRIPTASKIGAGLYPARDYKRSDEKYNLFGEVEFEERGLGADEFSTSVTVKVQ